MKRIFAGLLFAGALGSLALVGPARSQPVPPPFLPPPAPMNWKTVVRQRVAEYGHRNWIVVVDSAYPAQSRGGIETISTGAELLDVTEFVLDEVGKQKHVRPLISLDAELPYVSAKDAPGIETHRTDLKKILGERKPEMVLHDDLIGKLDKAGATFQILILKTTLTLPYTSVFVELDCGYWSADAEKRLRESMAKPKE